jgi:hypothetical protein
LAGGPASEVIDRVDAVASRLEGTKPVNFGYACACV